MPALPPAKKKPVWRMKRFWAAGLLALCVLVTAALFYPLLRTLNSLRKLPGSGSYSMTYTGGYGLLPKTVEQQTRLMKLFLNQDYPTEQGACSIFIARGDHQQVLFGRNFDWYSHPGLVLFSHPPDGYASIAMVDLSYLGFRVDEDILQLPWYRRLALLGAPLITIDGMNEYGLAVAVANAPQESVPQDPALPTINSAVARRLVLDHARNVAEAVALLRRYNLSTLDGYYHFLIADSTGRSVAVEYLEGKLQVIEDPQQPWQAITNFNLARMGSYPPQDESLGLWRYQKMAEVIGEKQGVLSSEEAMQLLQSVAQPGTIWSAVYHLSTGDMDLVRLQQYDQIQKFHLPLSRK